MRNIDIERFVTAQEGHGIYDMALQEIKDGRKLSHWMWFVFPQIEGLGHSRMSRKYGISSLLEAKAYWEDDILHDRMVEMTDALLSHGDDSAEYIMGDVDAVKLRSCMTLFDIVSPHGVFRDVLDTFYDGERCEATLSRVKAELDYYNDDSAFERNGIDVNVRGFFEQSAHEAHYHTFEQCVATLLDLMRRGDSMQKMTAYYLWHKDFMPYRVSDVELSMTNRMQRLVTDLLENTGDKEAVNLLLGIYHKGDEVHGVMEAAEYFDDALATLMQNGTTAEAVLGYIREHSIAKPEESADEYVYNGVARPQYTPDRLSVLKPDEVFVFGSNLQGRHGGGAARVALNRFGAVWGQGVGLQGQSYAIPTMQGGVDTIKPYVDDFVRFARQHRDMFFYVTRIGCGIAGFKDEDIAPLFAEAQYEANICLPESFVAVIKPTFPPEVRQMMYGQMRTLVDLLKAFNAQRPIMGADDAMSRINEVLDANVRYGDETAMLAIRTLWALVSQYEQDGHPMDIDRLERDLHDYHRGNGWVVDGTMQGVMYRYIVSKLVKYIKFLNDFRRYESYQDVVDDLYSIPVNGCGSNDEWYYFSFGASTRYGSFRRIIKDEWNNMSRGGHLDNDLLEEVVMGRYQKALARYGIRELIRRSYADVGCHPDIKRPKWRNTDNQMYGPYFRVEGGNIEKGCSDFRRYPFSSEEFEMRFASAVLDRDADYVRVGQNQWDELYIPCRDYTLPVYSLHRGKLHFDTEEEKREFIDKHRQQCS